MSESLVSQQCPTVREASGDEPEVITLGCRLNGYESEVIRRHATAHGIEKAVIVNTCAVTNEAVRQAAQMVRRLRRDRPDARIIVTGCAAQIEPDRFARIAGVDAVIGNDEKLKAQTYAHFAESAMPQVVVNDIMSVRETAPQFVDGFVGRARAFVQIQNGCDHRCTFCIIPYGRGPSRSVPAGDVVRQIRQLVENGYREVILTGVDITSYGPDLPGAMTLGKLVRHILKEVQALPRLRLSSIDQVEADADLIRAFGEEERLMPHLHLSLQSGDDMILKRMKRRHLRADSIRFCQLMRSVRPDVVFGADLIAGFPTEDEEMFQRSLDIVDACALSYLHVFPYSARHGTPAARMPQIDGRVIRDRAERLRRKGRERLAQFLQTQVGRTCDVLFEGSGVGRTPHYAEVEMTRGAPLPAGQIGRVRVTACTTTRLQGEVSF